MRHHHPSKRGDLLGSRRGRGAAVEVEVLDVSFSEGFLNYLKMADKLAKDGSAMPVGAKLVDYLHAGGELC
jgi:hypothetical protein